MLIPAHDITGLVLAGGRGSRMGGVDKGLQPHHGVPLALHALRRLAPQVGSVMLSANRNHATYSAFGAPVWADALDDAAGGATADALPDYAGPLAGILAGLSHCTTPYLVSVPCDSPNFPTDLVARLAAALTQADAEIAIAATPGDAGSAARAQPVFCLMPTRLRGSLDAYVRSGERKVEAWTARHRCVHALFDDAAAFANANTLAELQQLQTP